LLWFQEEPELEKKAKEFMEIGYNRQQKYRHPDGAYSIWGKIFIRHFFQTSNVSNNYFHEVFVRNCWLELEMHFFLHYGA
jgi:hypothetical protein